MLTCSEKIFNENSCNEATNVLKLQFESIKEISLCTKIKSPSEILENLSSENELQNFSS